MSIIKKCVVMVLAFMLGFIPLLSSQTVFAASTAAESFCLDRYRNNDTQRAACYRGYDNTKTCNSYTSSSEYNACRVGYNGNLSNLLTNPSDKAQVYCLDKYRDDDNKRYACYIGYDTDINCFTLASEYQRSCEVGSSGNVDKGGGNSETSSSSQTSRATSKKGSLLSDKQIAIYKSGSVSGFFEWCEVNSSGSVKSSGGAVSGTGYERLKQAVKAYGQTAMEMQEEYGTPWEVVFAQMQKESNTGAAGVAVTGATNNWLGITGSGDAGSYYSGREWAVYSSVDASIKDWSGTRVLRNGYYNNAFGYLDYNNYDLDSFVRSMVAVYAPAGDGGNNPSSYSDDVMSFINGPIREAREEMGWPSSAEYAKDKKIGIGGKHPLGSTIDPGDSNSSSGGTSGYVSEGCSSGSSSSGSGDINKTAIELAWEESGVHSKDDPKPAYKSALADVGLDKHGNSCVQIGASCDAFVATVMRYSGADEDFPCCGAAAQQNYLQNNPGLYEKISDSFDPLSTDSLQPGDILSSPGHIAIYVVLNNDVKRIAQASHCDRTAELGSLYDMGFKVFRKK